MRVAYWLGEHSGWVLLVAMVSMVVSIVGYIVLSILAEFDRDSSLSLVVGLSSSIALWVTLLAIAAVALAALRPPQAKLSLSATTAPQSGRLRLTVTNSGRVTASDVVVELVTGPGGEPLEVVGRYWEVVETEVRVPLLLGQDSYRTVFKRWGSLPVNPRAELVVGGVSGPPRGVRITASNADEVLWQPEGPAQG